MVLRMLRKVEAPGAIDTAKRLRQHVSGIFQFGMAEKLVPGDPAVGIKKALKPMPAGGEQPVLKDLARGLIAKWRKSKGEPWVREALVGAEGQAEPVSWIEPRLTSASNIEDEARAVSHATAERYRRMEIPGPPAVSRAGEAAVA